MLKIFNTLSGKIEIFHARRSQRISIFVCGITPYDFSHVGHARTYVAFDMIVKYLRHAGYEVTYLQNVTDVDDKIIARAQEHKENPKDLARRLEKEYMVDMEALGVDAVNIYARATDHVPEIISQVDRMLKKRFAYEIEGDGIYFDISKFEDYGKLSRRTTEQTQDAVSRIDESVNKRNKGDFALWKYSKEGEPSWSFDSSLRSSLRTGRPKAGRPGWHIEDTAITEKFFGPQYDIHGGAQDLIFPHHEAEITQMESISGKEPFVRYWMHTGFLTVKGEKMSKSLGNFITIRDFLSRHSARLLRFFILKTHYRSPIDYSEELLWQAQNELERIDEFVDRLRETRTMKHQAQTKKTDFKLDASRFKKAMEDDFNTPRALAAIFEMITKGNTLLDQGNLSKDQTKQILEFLKDIDIFFGFIFRGRPKKGKTPEIVLELVKQREMCRQEKQWQNADELREQIKEAGWLVEDTEHGPEIKKQKKH